MRSPQPPLEFEDFLLKSGASSLNSPQFSKFMDTCDSLRNFRQEFAIPKVKNISQVPNLDPEDGDKDCLYFTGNSLGLQCKKSKEMVNDAMKTWAEMGVEGWFHHGNDQLSWTTMETLEQPQTKMENGLAKLVGAKPIEVGVGATLTQNLNSLLLCFYKPTSLRHKILIESNAFPSDRYAIESQIRLHDFNPAESLILLFPRQGEHCLRTEDILDMIDVEGDSIALVLFSGIQYYTGQLFNIEEITKAGQAKGCFVGWDLAHAAGNVPLNLHSWNVDFAVWCSYKYLNAGPGGIGCLFLHERYAFKKFESQRLAGWWGLDVESRFKMENVYFPRPGAAGFAQSTVDILSLSSLLGSLQLFDQTNMDDLRRKSILLTSYLEYLLKSNIPESWVSIMTPSKIEERGCQLSLLLHSHSLEHVSDELHNHGVICDQRNPNCLRVSPVPMYNTFEDVRRFVEILKVILK